MTCSISDLITASIAVTLLEQYLYFPAWVLSQARQVEEARHALRGPRLHPTRDRHHLFGETV
jgi:hypothetical protein